MFEGGREEITASPGDNATPSGGIVEAIIGDGLLRDVGFFEVEFPDMDAAGDAVGSGKYVTASPGDKAIT